jgi:hypothetical protein
MRVFTNVNETLCSATNMNDLMVGYAPLAEQLRDLGPKHNVRCKNGWGNFTLFVSRPISARLRWRLYRVMFHNGLVFDQHLALFIQYG